MGLDATALATEAQVARLVVACPRQRVVAPLAGQSVRAVPQVAERDDAGAHAGAEDASEDHLGAGSGSVGGLRQREAVGIVGHDHGLDEQPLEVAWQRPVVELRRVAVLHHAALGHVARRSDADGAARAAGRLPRALDDADDRLQRRVVVALRRRDALAPALVAAAIEHDRFDLGATDIDTDGAGCAGRHRAQPASGSVRFSSHASASPLTSGDRRSRTCWWYRFSHAASSARSSDTSMQRVSIGHRVSASKASISPNAPPSGVSTGTASARFSMRTPHFPGRYTPGSIDVIMPGCIAICGSGTAWLMVCGPSCTLRK